MPFEWFTGNKPARPGGRPGMIVILADTSGSMDINALTAALREVACAVPRARVFVYATEVAEAHGVRDGAALPEVGGCTNLESGLTTVAEFFPLHTIVLSDGWVNEEASHAAADRMTGAISALWIGCVYHGSPDGDMGRKFMRELARKNGGEFRDYDPARGAEGLAHELINMVHVVEVHHHRGETRHVHHGREQHAIQRGPSTVTIRRR